MACLEIRRHGIVGSEQVDVEAWRVRDRVPRSLLPADFRICPFDLIEGGLVVGKVEQELAGTIFTDPAT